MTSEELIKKLHSHPDADICISVQGEMYYSTTNTIIQVEYIESANKINIVCEDE